MLLYNGRFNERHDFVALEIVQEQVQLTFSAGESTSTVFPFIPGGVSDGQWHTVHLHYYNKVRLSHAEQKKIVGGMTNPLNLSTLCMPYA
uniref:Cadherin EGF LAG seven-pass G-type receptor 2 n=1 Tax=Sphaerodactylus townsendi TaxID=933632 RepID=A0ACB8F5W9_9SAUR